MNRVFAIGGALLLVWIVAAVVAITYGTILAWPDFVHVDYGFPLIYATHVLNTIAGPVDKWTVDLSSLVLDLIFWFSLCCAISVTLLYFDGKSRGRAPVIEDKRQDP